MDVQAMKSIPISSKMSRNRRNSTGLCSVTRIYGIADKVSI